MVRRDTRQRREAPQATSTVPRANPLGGLGVETRRHARPLDLETLRHSRSVGAPNLLFKDVVDRQVTPVDDLSPGLVLLSDRSHRKPEIRSDLTGTSKPTPTRQAPTECEGSRVQLSQDEASRQGEYHVPLEPQSRHGTKGRNNAVLNRQHLSGSDACSRDMARGLWRADAVAPSLAEGSESLKS